MYVFSLEFDKLFTILKISQSLLNKSQFMYRMLLLKLTTPFLRTHIERMRKRHAVCVLLLYTLTGIRAEKGISTLNSFGFGRGIYGSGVITINYAEYSCWRQKARKV